MSVIPAQGQQTEDQKFRGLLGYVVSTEASWITCDPLKWEWERGCICQGQGSRALKPRHSSSPCTPPAPSQGAWLNASLLEKQSMVLITKLLLCPPPSFILCVTSHATSEHTGHPLTATESTFWTSIHFIPFAVTLQSTVNQWQNS